jgi:hypothetical protein
MLFRRKVLICFYHFISKWEIWKIRIKVKYNQSGIGDQTIFNTFKKHLQCTLQTSHINENDKRDSIFRLTNSFFFQSIFCIIYIMETFPLEFFALNSNFDLLEFCPNLCRFIQVLKGETTIVPKRGVTLNINDKLHF